ncbi:exonuclease domain-containing protein [Flavobacterium difficile]|uniref:3'-5' exonuclease n=1 Tax=Flavobacterium difficile TaxID=2709659 RepID=A0ABX0I4A4_9FLAO|nr:exonuclease domain-containing protein [Flavobacterium difficile]NHM01987.1 3'-5' exonuclease [Flavobacterium difficile]
MLSKIFNKEYPEFWKKYTDSFKNPATKYVVISMETSGLDTDKDVIMAIAATSVINNRIILKDSFEIFIQHKAFNETSLDNEFITVSKVDKITESQSVEIILNYISNSILIGHRIDFDIEMLNKLLSKLKLGKIRNEAFDIEAMLNKILETNDKMYALDEMSNILKMPVSNRNSVADDAYSIALLFLKMKDKLGIR